jgi:hypothetical protein
MAEDQTIDDALRDVPLPAGIAGRMSVTELFTDAAIDRLLADVAVPAGLAQRLRAASLDLPAGGGVVDLERIGLQPGPVPVRPARPVSGTARRWLAALARDGGLVALSLCGVAGLFVGGMELSRRLERGGGVAATVAPRPDTLAAAHVAAPAAPLAVPVRPASDELSAAAPRPQQPAAPAPPPMAADDVRGSMPRPADSAVAADAPVSTVRGAPLPPTAGEAEPAIAGMRFVDLPAWARRGVPRVRGYDLAFELTHGESPFVDPAADPALAIDRPPLSLRTDTFDAFRLTPDRRAAAAGRPLRVEHVLAALPAAAVSPSASAPASSGPRLDMHVVHSLRKVAGVQSLLVEACVSAPPLDRTGRAAPAGAPVDATIVLDRAVGGAGLAWPWTCRALAATAAQMGPRDRLTVVVAGPEPQLALRRRGAAEVAALAAALERLSASGLSDLDAALRMARTAANAGSRLVVVAQAGSLQRGGDDTQAALAAWRQANAAPGGVDSGRGAEATARFVILDTTVADDSDPDTSSGGTAANPVALRRALLRQVFAVPTLVARQCSLAVTFPPGQVGAYRIIGHRQSVVDSLSREPSAAVDLHAGETVRVVYEVLPRPGSAAAAGGRDLATATLTWRSPAGAAQQEARATTGAGGPDITAALPSARGCELLLAVGLGDVAGESAHVGRRGTTTAALATMANRWQARGDVTPSGTVLIGCLERWASDHPGTR